MYDSRIKTSSEKKKKRKITQYFSKRRLDNIRFSY